MVISRNMLVRQRERGVVYRVIDEINGDEHGHDDAVDYVVLIDMDPSKPSMPELMRKDALLERLAEKSWHLTQDTQTSISLEGITKAERRILERRWKVLRELLNSGVNLYSPEHRAEVARQLAKKGLAARPLTYEVLRLYWRSGGARQGLLPRFHQCGAPGKNRIATEASQKVGRRRTHQPGKGLKITEEHRRKMSIAIARTPVGRDGRGMRNVYNHLLLTQYPEYVRLDPEHPDNAPTIEVPDAVPSPEQLYYYWKTQHSLEERLKKRFRTRGFENLTRLMLTGTLKEVTGPASRYYIDATVVDVYVVSRYNRNRIIGRPTLYLVVDQFSRLIVGLYIGLEPPCWVGAMLALWNCNIDKVELCAKYGIAITPEQWPTGHMPVHVMADRGELASPQVESLSAGFNIDFENAPPYSGQAKGVVERAFRTKQTRFGPYMPGYVDKEFMGRDAPPPALAAALDLEQLTKVFLSSCIMDNHHVIRQYEGLPEQIVEGVEFTPAALWDWGTKHLKTVARRYNEDHLVRYLWPEAKLKLSKKGFQFYRGLYYMGMDLREQQWFIKALREEQQFSARVHPHQLGQVYLLPNEARSEMLPAVITRRSERFAERTLSELAALESQKRRQNAVSEWNNRPLEARMTEIINNTVKDAKAMAKESRDPSLSNAERLRRIRANKADELHDMTAVAVGSVFGNRPGGEVADVPPSDTAAIEQTTRQLVTRYLRTQK